MVAVGHTVLVIVYHMLRYGKEYELDIIVMATGFQPVAEGAYQAATSPTPLAASSYSSLAWL